MHAEDFGFGNPPGYPHEFFITCEYIDIQASAGLMELWRWLLGVQVPTPLVSDSSFHSYGVFRFEVCTRGALQPPPLSSSPARLPAAHPAAVVRSCRRST